jgi:hypothetical protein
VSAPSTAKHATGTAVIKPSTAPLVCRLCSRSSSTGPTLVAAVRIDSPVVANAAINKMVVARDRFIRHSVHEGKRVLANGSRLVQSAQNEHS